MDENFWFVMRLDNYLFAKMAVDMFGGGGAGREFWTKFVDKHESN